MTWIKFSLIIMLIFLSACGDATTTSMSAATVATPAMLPSVVATTPAPSPALLPTAKATADAWLTLTAKAHDPYPTATPGIVTFPAPTATLTIPAGTPPCQATELDGRAGWQGATGSMAGYLNLTNRSTKDCTLQGRSDVQLLDGQGNALAVSYTRFCRPCAEPMQNQTRPPAIATQTVAAYFNQVVRLPPGESAAVMFVWSNWCKTKPDSFKLKITLPNNQGQLTVPVLDSDSMPTTSTPRCDASEAPSGFSVGPFENNR